MMLMKNFTATTRQLDDISIMVFTDEDGNDWYESQHEFSATSLKFMFDEKGNIVAASWDVSMLAPEDLSVAEIRKASVPKTFFEPGTRWIFDGKKIIPFVYSQEELQQQAEENRDRLLREAREQIIVPQTKLLTGRTLTDEQLNTLNSWLDYIDTLEGLDTTVLPVSWPEVPR
ncbi:tail fiber assembly protein [Enterobacter hormaechei]|uniref:tail fiber assembly protein n=1 Tax=Enterobacter hormaechei TaxID=158836 RepID=UPI00254B6D1C|nr:tail fiber assembly protein [Enterobacter hormaechei]MDK9635078.1 tail fiber assembly protein [Enterobacter hormaechei]